MSRNTVRTSKFLSLVLRHRPERIGITLDESGWTGVAELIEALAHFGNPLSLDELVKIVASSDKQRFAFNADRSMIRANQGHSVSVDLGLEPTVPPDVLYHGSTVRFVASIRRDGLLKWNRHHVHLHEDPKVAANVGQRRGAAVVLSVDAAAMNREGLQFFVTANGVWLTETVPPGHIGVKFIEPHDDDHA